MRSERRGPASGASSSAFSWIALVSVLAATATAVVKPEPFTGDDGLLLPRDVTTVGCFLSSAPLTSNGTWKYQTASYCSTQCSLQNMAVAATTQGNECFCGNQIPATIYRTSESSCNTPCYGYGQQTCGGNGAWTVYLTGVSSEVQTYDPASSSSSSSSTSSSSTTSEPATVVTSEVAGGQTLVVTLTATPNANSANNGSSGGSNTAGIAAGVVVGVVVLAAIIGGVFFWLRHKRRREAEAAYQQQAQVAEFVRGAQSRPFAHSYSTSSDQRLDPEAGRRNSVGSLADSEDYSRRILRVANPDHS